MILLPKFSLISDTQRETSRQNRLFSTSIRLVGGTKADNQKVKQENNWIVFGKKKAERVGTFKRLKINSKLCSGK